MCEWINWIHICTFLCTTSLCWMSQIQSWCCECKPFAHLWILICAHGHTDIFSHYLSLERSEKFSVVKYILTCTLLCLTNTCCESHILVCALLSPHKTCCKFPKHWKDGHKGIFWHSILYIFTFEVVTNHHCSYLSLSRRDSCQPRLVRDHFNWQHLIWATIRTLCSHLCATKLAILG